jgi:AraC-like DNA-binding protein
MHAHHAFQLTYSLGGTFSLQLEDRVLPGPAVVIAPDVPHSLETRGLIALLFVEPESRTGRTLIKSMAGLPGRILESSEVGDTPRLIQSSLTERSDRSSALRLIGQDIYQRMAEYRPSGELDRRVRQMIRWAGENLDETASLKDAAASVGLSMGRASHLFVEETGLPFRTYLLWLRVQRAVDAHRGGASLTEAAQTAGFADSAHLSRTFKRMFGIPAASLEIL